MNHLLEPQQLQSQLEDDNLIIVDLSNIALYQQQHIPGAVHLSGSYLLAGTPPIPSKCPSLEQLSKIISHLGIDQSKQVVICDDEGGGWAGRMAWTLDLLGFDNWHYLNGGMVAWIKEGFPTESTINQPTSGTSSDISLANPQARISAEEIQASLSSPDFAVWDARSPNEYSGTMVRAARGGHIPGAINLEWTALMDQQRNLRIRDNAQQILDKLGLTQDKRIATHCQSHHRSSYTYMVARILGYSKICGYDGSWAEWGNSDLPIETGL